MTRAWLVLAALSAASCHRPAAGWEWVEVPGATCNDGSPTGFGMSRGSANGDVLVVFEGGGQCWDFASCFVTEDTVVGPVRERDFAKRSYRFTGVLDRTDAASPFRDFHLVYIPYCTGDFHAGSNVATYTSPTGEARTFRHVGHDNVVADLRRLTALFPSPRRLVVSGISAGGFGAVANYATLRDGWSPRAAYLLDDSGPLLQKDAIPAADRAAMYGSWHLDRLLDPLCGPACRDDLSVINGRLAARYPHDRLALLSSLEDADISGTLHLSADVFRAALQDLARDVLDPTPGFRYFFAPGATHTMLFAPSAFSSAGKPLAAWLAEDVGDDPAWASVPRPAVR